MHRRTLARSSFFALVAGLVAGSSLIAQCVKPTGGTFLDDVNQNNTVHNVSLSFGFTFPGAASATTSLDIVNGGYIAPGGSMSPGPNQGQSFGPPSVTSALSYPTIGLCWTNAMSNSTISSGVYFHDNGVDQAICEWRDVRLGDPTHPTGVMWIELNADGSFAFVYGNLGDGTLGHNQIDIGFSPGNGATPPEGVDLSTLWTDDCTFSFLDQTLSTAQGSFDLGGYRFDFTPIGGGEYQVSRSQCHDLHPARKFGPSCDFGVPRDPAFAWRWTPNGSGYDVERVTAAFDWARIGCPIPFGYNEGDEIKNLDLAGGSFTLPNGVSYSSLDLDTNGRLLAPGSDISRWNPTFASLAAVACIAPFWTDLEPDDTDSAYLSTDGSTYCNITFLKTNEWQESNALTFQVQLDLTSGDSWTVVYEDVSNWLGSNNLIIGCSDGVTPHDYTDLAATGPYATDPTMGDGWAGGGTPHNLQSPGAPATVDYDYVSAPTDGAVFQTVASGIPATATDVYVIIGTTAYAPDFLPLNLVWPAFPDSCVLTHDSNIMTINVNSTLGILSGSFVPGSSTATFDMDLSGGQPGLVGLPLKFQLMVVDPGAPWAVTALPVITSNGIETVIQ
ncbi:MAG: hypothetical protein KDB80_09850 [Planctomycetes bacterium]|nr:hypothetical protein [Planctomycetota bacterium]